MVYIYTDVQLNYLNRDGAVYSINDDYVSRKESGWKKITDTPKNKNETNTLTTPDGQEFRVIATKSDIQTGFDRMAVDLFVND